MRYLLDTTVVSQLRPGAGRRNPAVVTWLRGKHPDVLWTSVVSGLELEKGVRLMERRDAAQGAVLRAWFEGEIVPLFSGRTLEIDLAIAREAGRLHVPDPRPDRDALIAATALVHGLTAVTRNVRDFAPMGVPVVDPWES